METVIQPVQNERDRRWWSREPCSGDLERYEPTRKGSSSSATTGRSTPRIGSGHSYQPWG